MQFSKLAFVAALTAFAQAQTSKPVTIVDLPDCAKPGAAAALDSSPCGTNIACACKDTAFINTLSTKLSVDCTTTDLQKAFDVAYKICAQAGVTLVLPSATSTSAPASGTAPAATNTSKPSNGTVTKASVPSQFTGAAEHVKGSLAAVGVVGVGALLMGL